MERKQGFEVGEYYHIYNRGVEKRQIFSKPEDWHRFLQSLYFFNTQSPVVMRDLKKKTMTNVPTTRLVAIGAYCLMKNHFHILLKEIQPGGISLFMEKISTSYSMYFNKKYERTGSLFSGRFQSSLVEDDRYLNYLFAYIHLNPLDYIDSSWQDKINTNISDFTKKLNQYRFSSFQDYYNPLVKREESLILSKEEFPDYFSKDSFDNFIKYWLKVKKDYK